MKVNATYINKVENKVKIYSTINYGLQEIKSTS